MNRFKSAGHIVNLVSDMFKPPIRNSVSECAESNFKLPDGSYYSTATTPYMVEAMNLLPSRESKSV